MANLSAIQTHVDVGEHNAHQVLLTNWRLIKLLMLLVDNLFHSLQKLM